jgi:membrane protein
MSSEPEHQHGRIEKLGLWRFGGLPIWKVGWRTWQGFQDNYLEARCAQFAFYSMLVIAPMMILIIGLLAKLPVENVIDQLMISVQRNVPTSAYELIEAQITDIQATRSTSLMLISAVILSFSGSRIFLTMGEGLNAAYGVPVRQMRWRLRGKSILFTVAVVPLLLLLMVAIVVGPTVVAWVYQLLEIPLAESFVTHVVRWILVTLGLWFVTVAIHCWIPSARQPWYWFSPGTVFTVVGWIVASQAFRFYVENFALYNQTYGALCGVIVMMLWLYMIGAVLLLGGQLNSVVYRAAREAQAATS